MKAILTSISIILTCTTLNAQELNWAFNIGNADRSTVGNAVTVDNDGSIFTTGYFGGTNDFDPSSSNEINLGTGIINKSFILKSNALGETVWAGCFQSNLNGLSTGEDIVIDNNNRIISTGKFRGITDFDPGSGTENIDSQTSGSDRTFISILNNDGSYVWAGALLGSQVQPTGIGVDANGNIFLTGNFDGTVDFDPGAGVTELASATTTNGNDAFFVLKLSSTGDFIWVKSIDGIVASSDLAVDSNGDVWVTGDFEETVDFDPGIGTNSKTSLGQTDLFTLKLNGSTGDASFLSILGGVIADKATGITIHNDIVYTIGTVYRETPFDDQFDLDPSSNTNYITGFPSAAAPLGFIQKLDLNGNFNSGIALTDNAATPKSIAINSSNEIYVTGSNLYHLFERKMDANGTIIWNHSFIPNAINLYNEGRGVVVTSNSVVFTGVFWRFGDFDPSPTTNFTLTCAAYASNAYVQHLKDNTADLQIIETKNVSIYPNPSNGIYTLKSNTPLETIEIYSNNGVKLFSINSISEQLDLTNHPSGIYFIKAIASDLSETTVRVIKN